MSIERSQSSQNMPSSQKSDSTSRSERDITSFGREPPSREQIDRFRTLMQMQEQAHGKGGGRDQHAQGASANANAQANNAASEHQPAPPQSYYRADDDGSSYRHHADFLPSAETAALLQAQAGAQANTMAATTAPAPMNPNAFAELIERHVRQLAVSAGGVGKGDGQVLLRLADATLPGTDLLLSRTADGWCLRADVRSRGSFDAIRDAAPGLARRFAERNLGTLTIDPHFHG